MPFLTFVHPIVLAPIAGPGTPALTAAVSNAGGLGILPCAYLTPARIAESIEQVRALTTRPFGVNLFVETPLVEPDPALLSRAHERLRAYREALGIPHPPHPARPPEHYEAQIDAVIAARPSVASFTFGIPAPAVMRRLHDAGMLTLGTATTVDEARANEAAGMDAVVAQGAEAGAHRGTFLAPFEESLVGTLALVPQVVDAVRIPVIAAGGIGDGRGVAAVLALGATAAALGSAFLLADEAATAPAYRRALASPGARTTRLTTVFSGRAARGIPNRMMREVAVSEIAPYPFQNAMTRDLRDAAAASGDDAYLALWAGAAVALARPEPAAAILTRVLEEARAASRVARELLPDPLA